MRASGVWFIATILILDGGGCVFNQPMDVNPDFISASDDYRPGGQLIGTVRLRRRGAVISRLLSAKGRVGGFSVAYRTRKQWYRFDFDDERGCRFRASCEAMASRSRFSRLFCDYKSDGCRQGGDLAFFGGQGQFSFPPEDGSIEATRPTRGRGFYVAVSGEQVAALDATRALIMRGLKPTERRAASVACLTLYVASSAARW